MNAKASAFSPGFNASCLFAAILGFLLVAGAQAQAAPGQHGAAQYVIEISLDAFHAGAIPAWGQSNVPNFWRFQTEGVYTDNARTDYDSTVTTPNHTDMVTARPINGASGHLWGENNGTPAAPGNLHAPHTFSPVKSAYSYVAGVFDVVHDNGLSAAMYGGKNRFLLFKTSYDATHGRLDVIGPDNGRNKIDRSYIYNADALATLSQVYSSEQQEVNTFISDMTANHYQFTLLHLASPDETGHKAAGGFSLNTSSQYMANVKTIDAYMEQIFRMVETDPVLAGKTAILLTADHGGNLGTTAHSDITKENNYRVPFMAWGAGVGHSWELYALNPQYTDPSHSRVNYSDPSHQPVRNGCISNLALDLLGLSAIPGSVFNSTQNLIVPEPATMSLLALGGLMLVRGRGRQAGLPWAH